MSACKPAAPNEPNSPAANRQEKVSQYLKKARITDEKHRERSKPLVAEEVPLSDVFASAGQNTVLPPEMQTRKLQLESWARAVYGEEAASRAGNLIMQYHAEAMEALKQATSAQDMAERLEAIEKRHQKRLSEFIRQEQNSVWVRPSAVQLNEARLEMEKNIESMLRELERLYGPLCAQKARPILEELPMLTAQAIGRAESEEEVNRALDALFSDSDKRVQMVVLDYGDPAGPMPEEGIQKMLEEMQKEYQPLENKVRSLYGKRAVLQLKPLFNQFSAGAEKVFRSEVRASEKEKQLEELSRNYQSKVAGLQMELNRRLSDKKTSRRTAKESAAQKKNVKKK